MIFWKEGGPVKPEGGPMKGAVMASELIGIADLPDGDRLVCFLAIVRHPADDSSHEW